jgi:hypothetical protein
MDEPGVLAPTTTPEQDRHSLGQRRVNLIWEITQALIALAVTVATFIMLYVGKEAAALTNAFFLVIGFYFGRTNHQRVGGVELGR